MATTDDEELPDGYEDYEVGSATEATVNDGTERVVVVDEDEKKAWWFDLTDISWFRANQIFSDNVEQDPNTGEGKLKAHSYYRDVAEAKTTDWSNSDEMGLRQFLTGLDEELGKQLEQHLPDPGEVQLEEGEEENSEPPSDDADRTTPE